MHRSRSGSSPIIAASRTIAATLLTMAIASQAHALTLVVDSNADTGDAAPGDEVCDDGLGNCTLRAALEESNARFGFETIQFDLLGLGVKTFRPQTALPGIDEWSGALIDGTTQPGYTDTPVIEIDGSDLPLDSGIRITGGHSLVKALSIHSFGSHGMVLSGSHLNTIQGCHIGVDPSGTVAKPNGIYGVFLSNCSETQIGGAGAGQGNVISGNGSDGIFVGTGSWGCVIEGNLIGTDVSGTVPLGNAVRGVTIDAEDSFIGGSSIGQGNIIADHSLYGIQVKSGGFNTRILGNSIGTDLSGLIAMPQLRGIFILDARDVLVGGAGRGTNIISGNVEAGLFIEGPAATGIEVINNRIGVAADGAPLPNLADGIMVTGGANGNLIGSVATGEANKIANNGRFGISINSGISNEITGNSIVGNGDLGIDIGDDLGVTPNDPGDADTGANFLQNHPILSSATGSCTGTTVGGSLESVPSQAFSVQFFANDSCDASGRGEGERFLGETDVTTDSGGLASFSAALPVPVADGAAVTAVAIRAGRNGGSSSEFSPCITATGGCGSCGNGTVDPGEDCDEGGIDTNTCDSDCSDPRCGDFHVNAAFGEECDQGGIDAIDCDADCTVAECGDGYLNTAAGEQCDDDNTTDGDGCSSTCQIEGCVTGDLARIWPVFARRDGSGGVELFWSADPSAAFFHVNSVNDKADLVNPKRSPVSVGQPECDLTPPTVTCIDADAPATGYLYYQVLSACGASGDDEGPY